MKRLSCEQTKALVLVARRCGRSWKAQLARVWQHGDYARIGSQDIASELQSVRNKLGPSGLRRLVIIPDAKVEHDCGCPLIMAEE